MTSRYFCVLVNTFVQYIKTYINEEINWRTHLIVGIFLAVCLLLNYGIEIGDNKSLYDAMVNYDKRSVLSWIMLIVFYCLPLFFVLFVVKISEKKKEVFKKSYVLWALIGIVLLSLDCSYYLMSFTNGKFSNNPYIAGWQHDCISNLSSFATIVIPLIILYIFTKRFKPEWFGFTLNGARILPYFWLILLMIPLIILASFNAGFIEHYPTYNDHFEYEHMTLEMWQTRGIYELCYGSKFVSVELFFRGFMVVGLSRIIGKEAILPMVAVYCFLHFGKPAGEAVSSIFGGYMLGILSYRSRNIYGGLIAHLGVAWGMEFMAIYNPFI